MRMVQKEVLENSCLRAFHQKKAFPQGCSTCFLKKGNLTKGSAMQRWKFCFVRNKEVLTTAFNRGSLNVNFSGLP